MLVATFYAAAAIARTALSPLRHDVRAATVPTQSSATTCSLAFVQTTPAIYHVHRQVLLLAQTYAFIIYVKYCRQT